MRRLSVLVRGLVSGVGAQASCAGEPLGETVSGERRRGGGGEGEGRLRAGLYADIRVPLHLATRSSGGTRDSRSRQRFSLVNAATAWRSTLTTFPFLESLRIIDVGKHVVGMWSSRWLEDALEVAKVAFQERAFDRDVSRSLICPFLE